MKPNNRVSPSRLIWSAGLWLVDFALVGPPASAASILGAADDFTVLGAASVTITGPTEVSGNVGVDPGGTIAGLSTLVVAGALNSGGASAAVAHANAVSAAATLAAMSPTADLTGVDLGVAGVLTPGVYRFAAAAGLTGAMTLDFAGHPNTPFVFQIGSAMTTASASSVTVLDGGPGSAIYWLVGSSATLGTGTTFAGNLIADQSITVGSGSSFLGGRVIALNVAVTLDTSVLSNSCLPAGCSGGNDFGSGGFDARQLLAAPEPAPWTLMLIGAAGLGAVLRGRRLRSAAA